MIPKKAIQCRNLSLYYGTFHALRSVNFYVTENKINSLIGPSGCGKSTLLRVFNRMNDIIDGVKITGDVMISDKNLKDIDIHELRRNVGMVFQRPNPFPLSVYENISYGIRIYRSIKRSDLDDIVKTSLEAVGLWDTLKDRLRENALKLSGEQQQRICIARCIATKPKIILMDEPCSALDPIATARIEDLMKDLKNNYTIVIVTHNMQQAARVSDDCGFMLLGELVEFGKTVDVFTNPKDKRTEDYISGRYG